MNKKSKAVIYLGPALGNISQDEMLSECRRLCYDKRLDVLEIFREHPSDRVELRTEFQRLVETCLRDHSTITHVAVYGFSGLFRDYLEFEFYSRKFEAAKISLISATRDSPD